jgi:flagellar biosynthetic protein FliR
VWPLTRIGAALMTAPLFSTEAGNIRIRLMLVLALSILVYPLVKWPVIDPLSAAGLTAMFNQVVIGLVMGTILQVIVSALVVGGQAISAAMGLSMANLLDPALGSVPILSQFMLLLGSLIFLDLGGHIVVISCVVESFQTIPVDAALDFNSLATGLLAWSSMMFLGATLIALPVLACLLLVNLGIGVMTRSTPSFNVFSVGFPAMIMAGFLFFLLSIGMLDGRLRWLWAQAFERLRSAFGAA